MIEIKNLTKKYKNITVLDDLSLTIENGVTCILGESGSGKTTLLNAISSLTDYDGFISKVKCSYAFQSPNLLPNLTVYDNLKISGASEEDILFGLNAINLTDKKLAYPNFLSGGERQRVALLRGLLKKCDYLLLDEPFSSLDLKNKRKEVEYLLNMLKSKPTNIIFVTHDINEAVAFSDEILILKHGKIIKKIKNDSEKKTPDYFSNAELKMQLEKLLTL